MFEPQWYDFRHPGGGVRDPRRLTSTDPPRVMAPNKNQETQCTFSREVLMPMHKAARLLGGLIAAVAALGMAVFPHPQERKNKKRGIYDLTGPPPGGGFGAQHNWAEDNAAESTKNRR